jgi:hypothetical protein
MRFDVRWDRMHESRKPYPIFLRRDRERMAMEYAAKELTDRDRIGMRFGQGTSAQLGGSSNLRSECKFGRTELRKIAGVQVKTSGIVVAAAAASAPPKVRSNKEKRT